MVESRNAGRSLTGLIMTTPTHQTWAIFLVDEAFSAFVLGDTSSEPDFEITFLATNYGETPRDAIMAFRSESEFLDTEGMVLQAFPICLFGPTDWAARDLPLIGEMFSKG